MLRLLAIPVVLLGLLAGALFWSASASDSRADFTYINRGDHLTLDVNDMSYMQDIRLAYALWEGIYALDPVKMAPVLGSADNVTVSPDQRVYTIHIRGNARWSNGDPLLADDFLFEWRRMLESPREYSYLHYYIKGAKDYEEAYAVYAAAPRGSKPPKPDFATVGEERLDDHTLRVTLANPVPYFPAILAFPCFFPMNEKAMAPFKTDPDPITGSTSYRPELTQPPHLVTNGPYWLAKWEFKKRVRLEANPYFWNAAATKSKTIDEIYAADPLAAYRLYQQGDVDWLSDIDPEIAASLLHDPGRKDLHVFTGFGTYFYELNCQPKLSDGRDNPLRDVRIRQALAMSIDKVPIVRDCARLNQPIATTYIPVGAFAGYQSPPGIPFNPKGAQKLLADAGFPGGRDFPRISILYNTDPPHADIATIIRKQWHDTLGIDVDAQGEELSQYKNDLHNHRFVVARAAWFGDYNDPSTFTDKYLSTSENNAAGWVDDAYDKLCADAALQPDPVKRFALFHTAEDRLLTQVPIIPLYTQVGAYLFRNDVRGLYLNAQQMMMFQGIYVEKP